MWLNIRVCAQTAKHGLEGLEIAGRPAHIEFWTPPGAAYLPMPMVAPPAPPPPPPAGWSSAPMAAPSSPSGYVGMFAAPSPSYGSYTWVWAPPCERTLSDLIPPCYPIIDCSHDFCVPEHR